MQTETRDKVMNVHTRPLLGGMDSIKQLEAEKNKIFNKGLQEKRRIKAEAKKAAWGKVDKLLNETTRDQTKGWMDRWMDGKLE